MRFYTNLFIMLGSISMVSAAGEEATCGASYLPAHADNYTGFQKMINDMPNDEIICVPPKSWVTIYCDPRTAASVWGENTSNKEVCFSKYVTSRSAEVLLETCVTTMKNPWVSAWVGSDGWYLELGTPKSQKC